MYGRDKRCYYNLDLLIKYMGKKKHRRCLQHVLVIFRHLLGQLQILRLPLPTVFGGLEVLVVRLGREPHGLDGGVVEVEAELNPLVEGQLRLAGRVDVRVLLGLHEALLVIKLGLDDAITDCLEKERETTIMY